MTRQRSVPTVTPSPLPPAPQPVTRAATLDDILNHFSWMTATIMVIAIIVVVVGGVQVIIGDMSYTTWVSQLWKFAGAIGLTAVGRGISKVNRS